MQYPQSKHESLKCTHEDCQELQGEDGEFCEDHFLGLKQLGDTMQYETKYINAIKESKDDEALIVVINKLYEDGFQDGKSERIITS